MTCINKMSFPYCLSVNKFFQTSDHSNRFTLITIYENLIKKSWYQGCVTTNFCWQMVLVEEYSLMRQSIKKKCYCMVLLLLEQTGIRHASYALHGFTFSKVKISISWNKVECLKKKKKYCISTVNLKTSRLRMNLCSLKPLIGIHFCLNLDQSNKFKILPGRHIMLKSIKILTQSL